MLRRPPRSTRTDTLCPYTTVFRSLPPMVVISSVTAQLISLAGLRPKFDWPRAAPFLIGGALGVPLGVAALTQASPDMLRLSVGIFLVCYAISQLSGLTRLAIGEIGRAHV